MKEDENIAAYLLWIDETVNAIIGLGEEIEESVIVQKVLRYLPMRFNPKISTLEERSDLKSISMEWTAWNLHSIWNENWTGKSRCKRSSLQRIQNIKAK